MHLITENIGKLMDKGKYTYGMHFDVQYFDNFAWHGHKLLPMMAFTGYIFRELIASKVFNLREDMVPEVPMTFLREGVAESLEVYGNYGISVNEIYHDMSRTGYY